MDNYFEEFRRNTIGYDHRFNTCYGMQKMYYCDYTASGRLYRPIEDKITDSFGQFIGNTHSETSITGRIMTEAYHHSREIIKKHVNANQHDILIISGFGTTSAVNKLQRILGLRAPDYVKNQSDIENKPVVFVSHMEHHSNHTTWIETIADVVCIEPTSDGLISLENLEKTLIKYNNRKIKIGSFTACSNVTGIKTPYYQIASLMHKYGGVCFVDFAASAPYVDIDTHPSEPDQKLDGIFFSPHKFLGGPGTSGILIFDSRLYKNQVPDRPGGGTVDWTNPWGGRKYINSIEVREDGGTPGFIQAIRTALCIELKNKMSVSKMVKREEEITKIIFEHLDRIDGIHILAGHIKERLSIVSFYADNIHYNLFVTLLNDRFGIRARGGCSCAGTYGHYLLSIDEEHSKSITDSIDTGDLTKKPGWIRLSFHPIMTNEEVLYAINAVNMIMQNIIEWEKDYIYDSKTNHYYNKNSNKDNEINVKAMFDF